jgi:WD40 repeat protein
MTTNGPITISCPHCQKRLKASREQAGKHGKCPKCGTRLVIPSVVSPSNSSHTTLTTVNASRICVLQGEQPVKHLHIAPDGMFLASSTGAWRLQGPERLNILKGRKYYEVSSLAISSDSSLLFASGHDNNDPALMRLWNLQEGKLLKQWKGPENFTQCSVFTVDGTMLATGTYPYREGEHFIRLWSMPECVLLATLKGHAAQVEHLTVTPDGKCLISGDSQGVVRIWELPSGKMVARCRTEEQNGVGCLTVTPNGRIVADGTHSWVRLWAIPDGRSLQRMKFEAFWIRSLVTSPDSKLLAGCGSSRIVRVWSLPDGQVMRDLKGHQGNVTCLAISRDGQLLASGGEDQDVILWNLPDGRRLATLEDHPGKVLTLAFSPNSRTVAVGSEDGTVILWDISVSGASVPASGAVTGTSKRPIPSSASERLSGKTLIIELTLPEGESADTVLGELATTVLAQQQGMGHERDFVFETLFRIAPPRATFVVDNVQSTIEAEDSVVTVIAPLTGLPSHDEQAILSVLRGAVWEPRRGDLFFDALCRLPADCYGRWSHHERRQRAPILRHANFRDSRTVNPGATVTAQIAEQSADAADEVHGSAVWFVLKSGAGKRGHSR